MKSPRRRKVEKLERELDKYEQWKIEVVSLGGSLSKDKDGKLYGSMKID